MKTLRNEGFVICEQDKPRRFSKLMRFKKKVIILWICNL